MDKLKVRAVGDALLPDFEAADRGIRKFVGRKLAQTSDGRHGFESEGDVLVPNTEHYRAALKAGDLEPCDQATANAVGLTWADKQAKKKSAKSEGT